MIPYGSCALNWKPCTMIRQRRYRTATSSRKQWSRKLSFSSIENIGIYNRYCPRQNYWILYGPCSARDESLFENAHGGQQVQGINYWETYTTVVTWFAIRLMLTLVLLHQWSTLTVDFVLAYP